MAEEFDIDKVNDFLELANYPYYDKDNEAGFIMFMSGFDYQGNPDINIKTAYIYSIFVNMVTNNATGYAPAVLHQLAYSKFITNAGKTIMPSKKL